MTNEKGTLKAGIDRRNFMVAGIEGAALAVGLGGAGASAAEAAPEGGATEIDVMAMLHVIPGKEQDFEALATQLASSTLANDKGCLRYEWYRATGAPHTYILIERWTDRAALQAHETSEHFVALIPKLRELAAEKLSVMPLARLA